MKQDTEVLSEKARPCLIQIHKAGPLYVFRHQIVYAD